MNILGMDDALQFISGADVASSNACDHCGQETCHEVSEPQEETMQLGLEELNTGEKVIDDSDLAF